MKMGKRRGLGEVKEAAAANEEPFARSSALSAKVGGSLAWLLSGWCGGMGWSGRRTVAQRTAFRLVFISEKGYESS